MTIHPAIPGLGAALFLALSSPAALAGPLDLPGGCAVAHAALHGGGGGFEADGLEVALPGQPGAALHAAHLSAALQGASLPPGGLQQASTAAAAGLVVAISGHRAGACPDDALRAATEPLARAIGHGGHASLTWTGLSVRADGKRFGARRLSLKLDGSGPAARLSVSLDGAVSNDPAAGLLPEAIAARASLPASEIPALLSATGGHGAPVDVTIEHVEARRGETSLDGHGQVRVAADPSQSSGDGHLTAHGYDALLDAAGASGLQKLRTALFLAKLVAHRQGDQADWDLSWQQGTLMVNNVPLPLR